MVLVVGGILLRLAVLYLWVIALWRILRLLIVALSGVLRAVGLLPVRIIGSGHDVGRVVVMNQVWWWEDEMLW